MRIRYWLILAFTQAVWAGSYVAMKVAAAELPSAWCFSTLRPGLPSVFCRGVRVREAPFSRKDLLWILGLGIVTFSLSPTLQTQSLKMTQAVDVSILVSFEPIATVLVAALFLKERPGWFTWFAFAVATVGLFVLSIGPASPGSVGGALRLAGNLIFLSSLLCEAAVTVSGKSLVKRYPPFPLMGLMMFPGLWPQRWFKPDDPRH